MKRTPNGGPPMNRVAALFGPALVATLVGLLAATAHAGTSYIPVAGAQFMACPSNGMTATDVGTTVKRVWSAAAHASTRYCVYAVIPHFPCTASSNSFTAKTVARCNSTDTSKNVGYRCRYEVTRPSGDWAGNDASSATNSTFSTAAILGTANRDIEGTTGAFAAYDTVAGADGTVGNLCGRHGVLVCERGNNSDVTNNLNAACELEKVHLEYTVP